MTSLKHQNSIFERTKNLNHKSKHFTQDTKANILHFRQSTKLNTRKQNTVKSPEICSNTSKFNRLLRWLGRHHRLHHLEQLLGRRQGNHLAYHPAFLQHHQRLRTT